MVSRCQIEFAILNRSKSKRLLWVGLYYCQKCVLTNEKEKCQNKISPRSRKPKQNFFIIRMSYNVQLNHIENSVSTSNLNMH